jgi:hypothetical protein
MVLPAPEISASNAILTPGSKPIAGREREA